MSAIRSGAYYLATEMLVAGIQVFLCHTAGVLGSDRLFYRLP